MMNVSYFFFFFSSRRRHTRFDCDWSSDVCSSDLDGAIDVGLGGQVHDAVGLVLREDAGHEGAVYNIRMLERDRKSTRLNSSHSQISYAVFCLKKKKKINIDIRYV